MPTYNECQLRLHRDNPSTQWGFRLQGGKEFNAPLTVQRVFIGSPSAAQLQRGDILVAIDNNDVMHATQRQAMEFIKSTGTSLSLRVRRPGHVEFHESCTPISSFTQSAPQPQSSKPYMFQTAPKPAPLTSYETALQSAHVSRPSTNPTSYQFGGHASNAEPAYSSQLTDFDKKNTPEPPPAPPIQNYRPSGFSGSLSSRQSSGPSSIQSPTSAQYSPRTPQYTSVSTMNVQQQNSRFDNPPIIYQDRSGNEEDDDDAYQQKSVKDIKQMFNKPKQTNGPAGYRGQQPMAFNKFQPSTHKTPPPVPAKTKQPSYSQPLSPQSGSYDHQSNWNNYSQPATQKYPQSTSIQQHQDKVLSEGGAYGYKVKHFHLPPKQAPQPSKPCTTPSKTGKGPYGKKEFDPEQSAVYRMLMEEDKPKKTGDAAPQRQISAEQEPEKFRSSGGSEHHSDRFRQLVRPEDDQSRDEPVQTYRASEAGYQQQTFVQQQQSNYDRASAYGSPQSRADAHQMYTSKSQLSFGGKPQSYGSVTQQLQYGSTPQQSYGGVSQQSQYGSTPQQSYGGVSQQSQYGSTPQQSYGGVTQQSQYGNTAQQSYGGVAQQSHYGSTPQYSYSSSVSQQSHYGSTPKQSYGGATPQYGSTQQQSFNISPQYSSYGGGGTQQKSLDAQSYGISDF